MDEFGEGLFEQETQASVGKQESKPSRLERLKQASVTAPVACKPVAQVESKEASVESSGRVSVGANDSQAKPSHSGERGVPRPVKADVERVPSVDPLCAESSSLRVGDQESSEGSVCVVNPADLDLPEHWRGVGERGSIKDTRLLAKAARERWDIPVKLRRKAINRIDKALDSESDREAIAAVRALSGLDAINVAIAKHENPKEQKHLHLHVVDAKERDSALANLLGDAATRRIG